MALPSPDAGGRIFARLKQQLFRWRSDGSAPFRLGQRRIFIIPSRGGLLFALALVVMLIGAINYTLALGHALVFLLAGLGLTGMVHTFRNLYGLLITPGRCEPVFVGETAHFQLTLGNERNTPRLALEFKAETAQGAGKIVVATVDARESTKTVIPLTAPRRGWLELPRVRLSTHYPLGLFYAWCYLQPAIRCLVYPRPLASPLPHSSMATGGGQSSSEGGEEDFSGFRERQVADSLRHVAWKASARDTADRPLLIKQFAGGAEVELQLDWALTDPAQAVETRLSLLCGWILAAEAAHCTYGLRLPGSEIPPASGSRHRQRCLEALALFQA